MHLAHTLGWWGALGVSVGLAVASLGLAAVVVGSWPVDHFKASAAPFWAHRHPVVRGVGLVAKNLGGVVIFLIGIVLALPGVPGQGLLLMLIGVSLVDFPGKRKIEVRLIRSPHILRAVNRLRARLGHRPLEVD